MRVIKIILIIILIIAAVGTIVFSIYWYRNIHWYNKYEKALHEVHATEKQITLPTGSIINYGEVENDKPPLLLIHGQMGIWEDYALVMPELGKKWHIYAVDVYGHGESSHDESLYYLGVNCFLQALFGEKCKIFLENVASPNWRKLQGLGWQLFCQLHSHCRPYLVVIA